jgi:TRAP-type uncharacterized transport system fused permease subunit
VVNTSIFFVFIGVLIYLMGVLWYEASRAALNIALGLFITSSLVRMYLHPGTFSDKFKEWVRCLRAAIEAFAAVTAPLILLLAMLGVMVNLFVVSGWMIKLMGLLASIGEFHVVALIGVGFAIGVFLGLGIPPSACYILSAVIVIPPMTRIGINPWIAHFFLFFVAVPYFRCLLHEDDDGHAANIASVFLPDVRDFQLGYVIAGAGLGTTGCSGCVSCWMLHSSGRHPR